MVAKPRKATAQSLLRWYDQNRRDLPWRAGPGDRPDPYQVWLSEIMLQQTTVASVRRYFDHFVARWPTVGDLAAAELDDVLHAWQGLGYYARARNLHKCAHAVAADHGGTFPGREEALRALPGIGAYTAAAIAAIAFDQPATPVDGNIERVTARLFRIDDPLPKGKRAIAEKARALTPVKRPGDFAQAMMDLGATVCTPRNPNCGACPWLGACVAHLAGDAEAYPRRAAKKAKPTRLGVVFWITDKKGRVLVRRRPEKGLLGGMMEFPSTDWRESPWTDGDELAQAPIASTNWTDVPGDVRHTFTHFHLVLRVLRATVPKANQNLGDWLAPGDFSRIALPTVMKKVAKAVAT
ncbi:MAG: A/G-specific adenine glycosylase [Rhodospirillaceae bacterium]